MIWLVLSVLSLQLSEGNGLKVTQPYSVVTSDGVARLHCSIHPQPWVRPLKSPPTPPYPQPKPKPRGSEPYPYPEPEELRVSLLRGLHGSQEVCSSLLLLTPVQGDAQRAETPELQCHPQLTEGAVGLTVSGLRSNDTDIYRCVVEVLYPPPYIRLTGNGTLIHVLETPVCPVQEAQRQTKDYEDNEDDEDDEGESRRKTTSTMSPFSVPVVLLMALIVLVLLSIITFKILQWRQGRRENGVGMVSTLPHKMDAARCGLGNLA